MTFQDILFKLGDYTGRTDLVQFCGLAEGTNSATLKTTLAIAYKIAGTQYSKSATDNIAMTALTQQAISTYCLYLVQINAAGTVSIKKGTSVATDTAALPTADSANVAIGAFKIATNGSTTFTSGTTDLSAAGITATFYDIDTGIGATLVNFAIKRIEKKNNWRHMRVRTTASVAVSTHTITNPVTNYKSLISAHLLDSNGVYIPLEKTSYRDAITQFPDLTDDVGTPCMISEIATAETSLTPDASPTISWLLRPTTGAADTYTLNLFAYQYTPELDNVVYSTNWWTQNEPQLVIYGALAELEPFLVNDQRIMTWKALYEDYLKSFIDGETHEMLSGSLQSIRSDYVV